MSACLLSLSVMSLLLPVCKPLLVINTLLRLRSIPLIFGYS